MAVWDGIIYDWIMSVCKRELNSNAITIWWVNLDLCFSTLKGFYFQPFILELSNHQKTLQMPGVESYRSDFTRQRADNITVRLLSIHLFSVRPTIGFFSFLECLVVLFHICQQVSSASLIYKEVSLATTPAKPNTMYKKRRLVIMLCWTLGIHPTSTTPKDGLTGQGSSTLVVLI